MEFVWNALQFLHSWTRWLVVIIGVAAVVYYGIGLVQRRDFDALSRRLMNAFSTLIGLEWLIGLLLMLVKGGQVGIQRHYWEHLAVMTVAVTVANAHHGWRRRELIARTRYARNLAVIVAVFVLVFIGISLLPDSIQWRLYGG